MIEKQNDYFLNLLSNPTFTAEDFTQVGLSVDNTSILDKNDYLNSDYIRKLDVFKTNGFFDESKFNNFYDYAKSGYLDLAKIKELDDLGRTWRAYRNDISMPENLRDNSPQFKIQKVLNPLRQLEGFVTFGLRENPTKSIREIAQAQSLYNTETGTWEESPNDKGILGFVDNILDPKVLATWDFDADANGNPTSDKDKIVYHKGDRKLNYNGTYYYETLGNREVYGKEVLSAFDVLTTDGSTMNSLDFFDSDDIEKSGKGSFMRAAALIVPAFIPGVDTWYIGMRALLGLTQVLPVVGKMIGGLAGINTNNSFLSKMEAFDKALSFSLSDYVRGSQADNGLVLSDSHFWSLETGFKLIADVFTLLAELRWIFEKSSWLFSGLNKNVLTEEAARTKWIEDYINSRQEHTLKEILEGLAKGEDINLIKQIEWAKASKILQDKIQGAQKLGGKLSMAYMTGITTASSYGEMKELGATDLEAAFFTLGYSLAEFGLLNTEMGRWILPELKLERSHMRNVAKKGMEVIKPARNNADTATEEGKLKWWSYIFNLGKKMYNDNLGEGIGNQVTGAIVSNMGAEAMEETSEELLLDLSKTIYNAGAELVGSDYKFNDAFKNVFDRYAMSFLGGAIGGGIAGVLAGTYKLAKLDKNMTQELAAREMVNFILLGKGLQFLQTANKMTWASKNLDEEGNPVDDYKKSQDFLVKQNLARLINDILDILKENGADLSKESILKQLGSQDVRFGQLSAIASHESNVINWYLNRYNQLSKDLVLMSLQLKELEANKEDAQEREERKEGTKDSSVEELKKEIEKTKKELDKFKDGTMSDEFLQDAVFEMSSKISGAYINNFELWAEDKYKKPIDQFSNDERLAAEKEFKEIQPIYRDLIHKYRLVHIQNMEWLSKMMEEYDETYFKDNNEAITNLNEVLFGNRLFVIENNELAVPWAQQFFALFPNRINNFLYEFLRAILESLDESEVSNFSEKLRTITDKETSTLKRLGIDNKIETLEDLKNLSLEQKDNLALILGYDNGDVLIDAFIKQDKDGKDLLDEENNPIFDLELFLKLVGNLDVEYAQKRAEEFNTQLLNFLKNDKVKNAIIGKLKSAKYILPSVKLALDEFFNNGLQINRGIDPESGTEDILELTPSEIKEYTDSYKDVPSSPVNLYLQNVKRTLLSNGIDIAPTILDLDLLVFKLAKAKSLGTFSYDPEIELQIQDALTLIRFAYAGLDSAATSIKGDLSDAIGFNVFINNIREKRKKNKKEGSTENTTTNNNKKLVTISSDIALGIKMDIARYELSLLYFLALQNYNSNSILNEHDKTYGKESLNLYLRLLNFVSIEVPDWEDLSKLKQVLESSEIKDVMDEISEGNVNYDYEFKKNLTNARMKIDRTLYTIFKDNLDKSIKNLLKSITVNYKYGEDSYTSLNASEEKLPDKDFLWYLAAIAAANPDIIMNEYQSIINANYAPVIGQEEAIKKITAFLVNPKMFLKFADSWNEIVEEKRLEAKEKAINEDQIISINTKAAATKVNAYRAIFVEGMPGTGKSTAILNTVREILNKFHPKVLEKVIFISNSKENAEKAGNTLGLKDVQYFGIEEFRSKIMNNYTTPNILQNGSLKFEEGDTNYDGQRHMRRYSKPTLNLESLESSFLIIDEATSLSLMDAAMVDDWMAGKNIYGIYAGDFDLLGTSGTITENGKEITINLKGTNYISTHKLGQIIRGNNKYKTDNTASLKISKTDFIKSLIEGGKISPINFVYYLDDLGLFGDVVVTPDLKKTASGTTLDLDDNTKNIIKKMFDSVSEDEKINFIYDNPDSILYKYLEDNYKDRINKVSTNASQSLEGLYYIVDIALNENLKNTEISSIIEAENYFKMLYTATSRAKLGTLIFDRTGEVINNRIQSQRSPRLIRTIIGQESKENYAAQRKKIIQSLIPEGTPEKFDDLWWTGEEKKKEEAPEEAHNEEEGENEPYEPDIKNDKDDELNMMIHTFNVHEIGGFIDENGQLNLGDHSEDRVDNAHGIIKFLNSIVDEDGNPLYKIEVSPEGKLSVSDTQKIQEIIDEIRNIGTYGTSISDIISDINSAFKDIFKIKTPLNTEAIFIYKNTPENETLTTGDKLNKFFKGVKDRIRYLFTKETDLNKLKVQETPPERTIGLELYINGQLIDIPIGVLTNPATIIQSDGFLDLKAIYDSVHGKTNLDLFTLELKLRKNAGEIIPHLEVMLKLLELYQWKYNHPKTKGLAVRLDKNFVLNAGGNKITGIQVPPTGKLNPSGARGKGYVEESLIYPGRIVTLEEYRREMPNRNISSVFEGINGNLEINGKVYLRKGAPFVLMSDIYKHYTNKELYEAYIDEIVNNKPRKVTRVYVNLPKKGLDYFLWNLLEAYKKEGNPTKAKDIDYSVGNKLTSFRLLLFMLQEDSNFLLAYREFMDSVINDPKFNKAGEENTRKYTLNRIDRLKLIMKILTEYENSLKDVTKEVSIVDGSGIESKIIETITKKKLFLNYLDLNIEELEKTNSELFKLFIPPESFNTFNTHPDVLKPAMIGNSKYTLRTALLFEFRRLLLGNYILENGTGKVFNINGAFNEDSNIVKVGENYEYKDFLKNRIDALNKDMEKNSWDGILTRTSLRRNSELSANIGSTFYKIAELATEDESFISSESFEFTGKLPTTAIIMDVAPMLSDILGKAVIALRGGIYETSSQLESLTDKEKHLIYIENMGAYLNGKAPSKIKSKKKLIEPIQQKILNSLDPDGNFKEFAKIIENYLMKNEVDDSKPLEELYQEIFSDTKLKNKYGVLKTGATFKIVKVKDANIIARELDKLFVQETSGNILVINSSSPDTAEIASYSEIATRGDISKPAIEKYLNYLIKEANPKYKVGDTVITDNQIPGKITDITIKIQTGEVTYEIDFNGNVNYIPQSEVDLNYTLLDNKGNPGLKLMDKIFGEGIFDFKFISEFYSDSDNRELLFDDKIIFISDGKLLISPLRLFYYALIHTFDNTSPLNTIFNLYDNSKIQEDAPKTNLEMFEVINEYLKTKGFGQISDKEFLDLYNIISKTIQNDFEDQQDIESKGCKFPIIKL